MPVKPLHSGMSENACGQATSSSDTSDKDTSVCPTCGQECKSRKGMYQHHARSHGEKISKVKVSCGKCGEQIKRWKSQYDGGVVYCSYECRSQAIDYSGENSPRYERVVVECSYCGENIERRPSRVERVTDIYCSRKCADNGHSERVSGDGNPRWLGGHSRYYGPEWPEQREKARERDKFTCQRCGVDESVLDYDLSVHHKTPLREFDNLEEAHELSNLITLCRNCHGKVEAWPVQPL